MFNYEVVGIDKRKNVLCGYGRKTLKSAERLFYSLLSKGFFHIFLYDNSFPFGSNERIVKNSCDLVVHNVR